MSFFGAFMQLAKQNLMLICCSKSMMCDIHGKHDPTLHILHSDRQVITFSNLTLTNWVIELINLNGCSINSCYKNSLTNFLITPRMSHVCCLRGTKYSLKDDRMWKTMNTWITFHFKKSKKLLKKISPIVWEHPRLKHWQRHCVENFRSVSQHEQSCAKSVPGIIALEQKEYRKEICADMQ